MKPKTVTVGPDSHERGAASYSATEVATKQLVTPSTRTRLVCATERYAPTHTLDRPYHVGNCVPPVRVAKCHAAKLTIDIASAIHGGWLTDTRKRAGVKVMNSYDDVVIGAGILGLAHAYHLASRGRKVIVLERDPAAVGASIRNFGMVWPIGQPRGEMRDLARRSLAVWLQVLSSARLWHHRTGSLHLAYHEDEAQVLAEFLSAQCAADEPYEWLNPAAVSRVAPRVRAEGLLGALWSTEETCVDPREVISGLPSWLERRFGVVFRFADPVTEVRSTLLTASSGAIGFERAWVCSGDELRVLFPELLGQSGLIHCKLQMMRSQAFPGDWSIGPMLAGGLTLRHYDAFRNCPGLDALRQRVARESPWFDRYGIHVMVSQNGRGELTIGDSHEYGREIDPFDKTDIEHRILAYLERFLDVPGLQIVSRWHGTYAKHLEQPYIVLSPFPDVRVVTGVGGAGMTLSFGLAERVIEQTLGPA
jgi:D-hydroxyproline dehydrogenase subunit beta